MRNQTFLALAAALLACGTASAQGLLEAARAGAAAPPIAGAVAVRTFASKDVPMDFTSSELKGTLVMGAGRAVELTAADGSRMVLRDGPVTLKYGKPSAWAFVTRDRSVSLASAQGTAAFPARTSHFDGFGAFSTEETPEQPVVLKGSQRRTVLKEWERDARHSCTYAGHCNRSALNHKGEMSYGYGYSSTCTGTREVVERVRSVRTDFTVRLVSRGTDEAVGVVTGEPKVTEEAETARVTGSCR